MLPPSSTQRRMDLGGKGLFPLTREGGLKSEHSTAAYRKFRWYFPSPAKLRTKSRDDCRGCATRFVHGSGLAKLAFQSWWLKTGTTRWLAGWWWCDLRLPVEVKALGLLAEGEGERP